MNIKVNDTAVTPDWSKMGVLSHSLGAMYITEMLQDNSTFAKASNTTFRSHTDIHVYACITECVMHTNGGCFLNCRHTHITLYCIIW